ncbi:MAG: acyl-ACP--UDP-N-acetylglucosamine O-acyltransferase [Sedimentisphaerales bacterium]|nr:acyl-ACP--UDP-N-acetylglucosamine O-acyltransferase [Sedimentisphaerales bacterium]
MAKIAATAVVDKSAILGDDVEIGPGCVVERDVAIGAGSVLIANVMIVRNTTLGENNRLHANVVLGDIPQSLGCGDPDTKLIVGNGNIFRENVTISRGSSYSGQTVIGNKNYFCIGSHLGHDCVVEDEIFLGNYSQISGHNKIERKAWISAFSGTHQFVTLGRFLYTGGMATMHADQPPFMRVAGVYPCRVRALNTVGLQRAGFSEESIAALQKAHRQLFRRKDGKSLTRAVSELREQPNLDENVQYLLDFLDRAAQHRMGRYLEQFRH